MLQEMVGDYLGDGSMYAFEIPRLSMVSTLKSSFELYFMADKE